MLKALTAKCIGDRGERIAAKYLRRKGYKIVCRNFRSAHGEIDLVAASRDCLVFVEVKTRKDDEAHFARYGLPCEAVDKTKQRHILYTARIYLEKHPTDKALRFDVVEVFLGDNARVNHIENAFGQ